MSTNYVKVYKVMLTLTFNLVYNGKELLRFVQLRRLHLSSEEGNNHVKDSRS